MRDMPLLCLLVLCLCCGCRRERVEAPVQGRPPIPFDGNSAMSECTDFVRLGPKPAGTEQARRAAYHIRDRLASSAVAVSVDEFTDAVPGGTAVFHNVTGTLAGNPAEILILAAHFDTKTGIGETFAGANDSGSGVGLLIALSKALAGRYPATCPELRFLFFDGEECRNEYGPSDGLHGSRRAVQRLREAGEAKKVKAMILVDMMGDRDLTVTIPRNGTPALIRRLLRAAEEEGVRANFGIHRWVILDDHQPFLDAGIPAVDVIDFEYGSAPGANDYWHSEEDTLDKLGAESLGKVGRVLLRVILSCGTCGP